MMKRVYALSKSISRVLEKDENSIHQAKNHEVLKAKDMVRGLHCFSVATSELSAEKHVSRSRIMPLIITLGNKVF